MKKVAILFGTRPEAIKLAPVIAALRSAGDLLPLVVNTGQHRELTDQVVELLGIGVDHDLAIMQPDQSLADLTARLVTAIDRVLDIEAPDLVLVEGDTTTVLAATLAAFYRHIPVGHVEAGLRTGDLAAPFPEEANRRLTTLLATLHFAPTEWAADNLRREGVEQVFVTGNPVIDALEHELTRQQSPPVGAQLCASLAEVVGGDPFDRPLVLVTGHRRENFGAGFEQICDAIARLADRFADHRFIYPVHLNPRVGEVVHRRLADLANVHLLPPLPYDQFVALLSACRLVLTDSGGVQEEAPSLGKPVLVMRETTERPEGVAAGVVKLVGVEAESIIEQVALLLEDPTHYDRMSAAANPYGDGRAAGRIVERVRHFLS